MPSGCQVYRDVLYEQLARLTKAIAHPKRLQILDLLLQAPRTVEVLAGEIDMSIAATSQHLQVLRGARLVESEKNGLYVTYSLADDSIYDLMRQLRAIGSARLAEVDQLLRQVQEGRDYEPAPRQELLRDLRQGEVVLLDVRPTEEYQAAHLPGALSIPLPELPQRLAELPKDRRVVAYCRGTYCLLAIEAGEFAFAVRPDIELQTVAVDDIGAFVAMAFDEPDRWGGKATDLAGDSLTPPEVARRLSAFLDRPVE
ncbi:metalloregulator ArsR/SmtB family transcription factor, partial [bacterium]|nr:metalloregulator ArsR/SmtB family transcription factor [bacterium]